MADPNSSRVTAVTAPVHGAPDEFATGWSWAEAATSAWLAAAEHAGLSPKVTSTREDDLHGDAAIIEVEGTRYALRVEEGHIHAEPM